MSTNVRNPADRRQYPERWSRYRGKQLFEVVDDRSETGEEELLSVSHITGISPRSEKNVTMFEAESLVGYKRCRVGDIAANTMWTWQGAIGVSAYDGVVSPAYNVYRQRGDYYHPRFLDLLLRESSLVDVYHSLSTGIRRSRLRLYPNDFLSIDFPVPPMEEQEKIVCWLDQNTTNIDSLIDCYRKEIELLDSMKRQVINRVIAKVLGLDSKRLKDVADANLLTLGESTPDEYEFRYVDIGSVDSINGITHYEQTQYSEAPSRARRVVRHGDVIISTVRTYLKAVALIDDDKDVVVSTGFAVLTPKCIESRYLECCLRSDYFCDEVMRNSEGVAYPAINVSKLMSLKIPVPDIETQTALTDLIRSRCEKIDQQVANRTSIIHVLGELKKVLVSTVVRNGIGESSRYLEQIGSCLSCKAPHTDKQQRG